MKRHTLIAAAVAAALDVLPLLSTAHGDRDDDRQFGEHCRH